MSTLHAIQQVTNGDLATAAEILARAFFDDPLQRHTFPDPDMRRALSPAHFGVALAYGRLFGSVHMTPGGVIVSLPPGVTDITAERAEEGGLTRLPEVIGADPADRFLSVLGAAEPMHHRHAPGLHWYVMVLGVSPEAQGTGLGRALLETTFAAADAVGVPVYLETAQPRNVSFYQHVGFALVEQLLDEPSGLDLFGFLRGPRHP